MKQLILVLLICFLGCKKKTVVKNNLEIELDNLKEGELKKDVRSKVYSDFYIDWANPVKWESSCSYYQVIPKKDTFEFDYFLDFCNDKFRWIMKEEKKKIDWTNQNDCLNNLENHRLNDKDLEHIKLNFYNKDNKIYYTTCEVDLGVVLYELQYDIDIGSFENLGSFGIDVNRVYSYYLMSSGLVIHSLEIADRETFEVFEGTMYGRDKNNIYYSRSGIIEGADLNSFEPLDSKKLENNVPMARDKNHLYIWDEVFYDTSKIKGLKEYLEEK